LGFSSTEAGTGDYLDSEVAAQTGPEADLRAAFTNRLFK